MLRMLSIVSKNQSNLRKFGIRRNKNASVKYFQATTKERILKRKPISNFNELKEHHKNK